MSDQNTCPPCGKPIQDTAYVCTTCTDKAREALTLVASIAGDITLTVAKLDRIEGQGGAEPNPDPWEKNPSALYPNPLIADLGAAKAHDAAVGELSTWARHCVETRGIAITGSGHPLAILAMFVRSQLDWLRHRQEAEEALRAITDACTTLVRIVDRPPAQWFAGRCVCGEVLLPNAGATKVRCKECGAEYDPDERKATLLAKLEEEWLTADQCAHAMTSLGVTVNASTVRTWAERGRLAPHPESLPGRPRYRVGSVRELADQMHAEQRERTLRAAVRVAEMAERKSKVSAR